MFWRGIENSNKIRTHIQNRALLSRSSTDIYADICTVYGSNSMFFSTVCRWVRHLSAGVGLLQVLLNLVDLNLQVVQRLFKKLF